MNDFFKQGWFVIMCGLLFLPSCVLFRKATVDYSTAKLPDSQIINDVKYWSSSNADPVKNRLDLFLPTGKHWPMLVFVHGGEWISGDRSLKVLGADIYRNIGRYFASQGIGVAVISYRLMPETNWKSQIMDVARAINWVHLHVADYNGDPHKLFVSGHSAGAQLAVRVALDPAPLQSLGASPNMICGVISISGAGYDMTDAETYNSAKKVDLFEKLFHTDDISKKLRREMSPQRFANASAPPFLILYAGKEKQVLQDGSIKLHEHLLDAGIHSQLFEIPSLGHRKIVLSLSQPNQITTDTMQVFMQSLSCP